MIAYKGFNGDLTCTFGKGVFQYEAGTTIEEDRSKCARTGLHCAEYVLDCLKWYHKYSVPESICGRKR